MYVKSCFIIIFINCNKIIIFDCKRKKLLKIIIILVWFMNGWCSNIYKESNGVESYKYY